MPKAENSLKRRQITFAADAKDGRKSYTPLGKSKRKSGNQDLDKKMVQIWLRQAQAGHYEYLSEVLSQFGFQGERLNQLFEKEGAFLLRCALHHWSDPEALRFICNNVSNMKVKEALREKNYSVLDSFLVSETVRNNLRGDDSDVIKSRQKILKLLCEIDREGLEEFISSDFSLSNYPERVRNDCWEAIRDSQQPALKY